MTIKDMFEVGEILEWEDKASSIEPLNDENCTIVGKSLNKNKIILHMKRDGDESEGNVFVRLKDEYEKDFPTSKKLLASQKVIGLTLEAFKNFDIESL
jgi:hypothetical protein